MLLKLGFLNNRLKSFYLNYNRIRINISIGWEQYNSVKRFTYLLRYHAWVVEYTILGFNMYYRFYNLIINFAREDWFCRLKFEVIIIIKGLFYAELSYLILEYFNLSYVLRVRKVYSFFANLLYFSKAYLHCIVSFLNFFAFELSNIDIEIFIH